MIFQECPYCGCYLDPGENVIAGKRKIDMQKELPSIQKRNVMDRW